MKQFLKFDNQEAVWFEEKGVLYVHIDSIFHSAGKQYGWEGDPAGIGLNEKLITFAVSEYATILLHIGNSPTLYSINAVDWKLFSFEHKSFYVKETEKGKIVLFIMQVSQLKQINSEVETQAVLP